MRWLLGALALLAGAAMTGCAMTRSGPVREGNCVPAQIEYNRPNGERGDIHWCFYSDGVVRYERWKKP